MARSYSGRIVVSAIIDHLLLISIVAPLVSVYWCGMFFLVDHYVFPKDYVTSIWFTCLFGFSAVFVCHVVHERLTRLAQLTDALYNPLARFYSIILIIVIVFQWRGFWYILDHYLGPGYISGCACIAAGFFLVATSGCSKSITGVVPFIFIADDKTNYFIALSKFSHLSSRSSVLHLVDHLYSVFYIQPSVIIVWRGVWHLQLQDYVIYPKDFLLSGTVTLGVGVVGAFLCYIIQWPLNSYVKRLPKISRFVVEQLWRIIVATVAICYWRGSWQFWALAFKGDLFTMWFVTVTSAFLLCTFNCWSIATLRGVWVDDPLDSQEDSILLDVHYCTEIVSTIEKEQMRKIRTMENETYPMSALDKSSANGDTSSLFLNHVSTAQKFDYFRGSDERQEQEPFALGLDTHNVMVTLGREFSFNSWGESPESVI
ncbi:uncharacterized protein LOC111261113 isoform X1 [Varroa jacobsoni]|uniref:uncharacterized protein LOC111261113 isoform X1 n=1 Tax=Varroa jacobsoni TaxID=62625 RepID=UPI000BF2CF7F|nr:uncharacterized protein LOC111261113 isoform X1 [Varroa jacobsoni]XP_022690103.1 uncharacterized protein LOC111261113 isoform X1 [Varroa jacobsoni]XP_022690104.1 uncharacterized protein LOC111261113 isoform X1 [Varroa jacobsoni]